MTAKRTYTNFSSYPPKPSSESSNTSLFHDGQRITCFSSALDEVVTGILVKCLTNSCIVDISESEVLNDHDRKVLNNKIVVSYQDIVK
ncbi:hypothetical protein Hs30E_18450 [Lactococcus hodotermopsidis]|uniref:DUF2187 domain-containing protein n=1 Tax=Pseudolactococcus hodotermopsidis TaxID=2709157 RepID=A0A6A0BFN4_9LACT|nr:hypothetical protein [Lactococcus hodotermopsidis]GFH43294.1 hypothetical protein Hs30E_18450 [Lactococcus hodotermopsidis]